MRGSALGTEYHKVSSFLSNALEVQRTDPMTNSTVSQSHSQLTIGMDLGDKISDFCVLGADGQILEEARVASSPEAFAKDLARFRGSKLYLEVGTHARWAVKALKAQGIDTTAINPRNLKLIAQSHTKTDKKDARLLAQIGQKLPEILGPVDFRGEEAQGHYRTLQARELLVSQRAAIVLTIKGLVKAAGVRLTGSTASFHKDLISKIPRHLQASCIPLVKVLETLTHEIKEVTKELEKLAQTHYPVTKLLRQIRGVGIITALSFVLVIGNPKRFQNRGRLSSYIGLAPAQRSSGAQNPQLGITKQGNPFLRKILVQAAHYILGHLGEDCDLQRWGLALCERGGKNAKKRAVVAVARKLATVMLALWKSGEEYKPLYNQGKNAV